MRMNEIQNAFRLSGSHTVRSVCSYQNCIRIEKHSGFDNGMSGATLEQTFRGYLANNSQWNYHDHRHHTQCHPWITNGRSKGTFRPGVVLPLFLIADIMAASTCFSTFGLPWTRSLTFDYAIIPPPLPLDSLPYLPRSPLMCHRPTPAPP
ncbi:hypothetical protein BJ912DRAFT_372761 [Pholiota molesta]|nr:hypothetical protein BJ912DRAFT_372761 [Pholiota molesta]